MISSIQTPRDGELWSSLPFPVQVEVEGQLSNCFPEETREAFGAEKSWESAALIRGGKYIWNIPWQIHVGWLYIYRFTDPWMVDFEKDEYLDQIVQSHGSYEQIGISKDFL